MENQITALMQGDKNTVLRFNVTGKCDLTVGQTITAQNAAYGGYSRYKIVAFEQHKTHGRIPVLQMVLTQ